MMLLDVGGAQYRDIDTNEQFLDVIQEKISFEFAEIIREEIEDAAKQCAAYKEAVEYDARHIEEENREYIDALDEIRSLAEQWSSSLSTGTRADKKKIIAVFDKIGELSLRY